MTEDTLMGRNVGMKQFRTAIIRTTWSTVPFTIRKGENVRAMAQLRCESPRD